MNYDLNGHKALVTGSSRGIGSAIAIELGRAGADVIVHCAEQSEKADNICGQIKEFGVDSRVVLCDLTNPEKVKSLCRDVDGVDILILNASVQIKKDWLKITPEEFTIQSNCNSLAYIFFRNGEVKRFKAEAQYLCFKSFSIGKPLPQSVLGMIDQFLPVLLNQFCTVFQTSGQRNHKPASLLR